MKNNFPFTPDGYRDLLKYALDAGYVFCPVKKTKELLQTEKLLIMLRHDIDLSLDLAIQMAQIEHELGIQSTYFVLLYNNFYNPLAPANRPKVKKIHELGHEIGFHWDSRDYQSGDAKSKFARNMHLIEEIIEEKIISGAQHEPNFTYRADIHTLLTYEAYRDFKDITYVSDSSMRWRQFTPWKLIDKKKQMQFLAHPFCWMAKGATFQEKFEHFRTLSAEHNKKIMDHYYALIVDFIKKTTPVIPA